MCEVLSDQDKDLEGQSIRLINLQRIYNIGRSLDQRILCKTDSADAESQSNETLKSKGLIAHCLLSLTKEMNHSDTWSERKTYER